MGKVGHPASSQPAQGRPSQSASHFGQAVGSGVDNPTFIHAMAPTFWNKDRRFKRFGERDGGGVAQGGYGQVFQGYDDLR